MNYNISTKGSDDMTQSEQIRNLIISNNGIIQTSQITKLGISKPVIYQYMKENEMEQIAHGVYATKDDWTEHKQIPSFSS